MKKTTFVINLLLLVLSIPVPHLFASPPKDVIPVGRFSSQLALARSGNLYGYINSAGTLIIPAVYEYASDFKNGYAIIKKDQRYGVIDTTNQQVIEPIYSHLSFADANGHFYASKDGLYGVIDKQGKVLIPFQYQQTDQHETIQHEMIRLKKDSLYGYINLFNEVKVPFNYCYLSSISQAGLIAGKVCTDKKFVLLNKNGKSLSSTSWDDIKAERLPVIVRNNQLFKLIDTSGKSNAYPLAANCCDWIEYINKQTYYTRSGSSLTIYQNGKQVLSLVKADAVKYTGKATYMIQQAGKWSVWGKDFKKMADVNCNFIGDFYNGFAVAGMNNMVGVMDHMGKWIAKPIYTEAQIVTQNLLLLKKDGHWKLYNQLGQSASDLSLLSTQTDNDWGYVVAKDEERAYLLDSYGKQLTQESYTEIVLLSKDMFAGKKNGAWQLRSISQQTCVGWCE